MLYVKGPGKGIIKEVSMNTESNKEKETQKLIEELKIAIESGNNSYAKKILEKIKKEQNNPEVQKAILKFTPYLSVDPWFYVIWGLSMAILLIVFFYYVIIK